MRKRPAGLWIAAAAGYAFLYVPTRSGSVERYDIANQTLLSPSQAGTSFLGADITPDGRYFYIAEDAGFTQGIIRKLDLAWVDCPFP